MLTTTPTQAMIDDWKRVYEENKDKLTPNKKSANEILDFLNKNYEIIKLEDTAYQKAICANAAEYLKALDTPSKQLESNSAAYEIKNINNGKTLYQNQDKVFTGEKIIVGLEFISGFFMVSGSSDLHDELTAFAGLNEIELTNYFLVAEYLSCLNKQTN